jgi:glc operon protein GlcG
MKIMYAMLFLIFTFTVNMYGQSIETKALSLADAERIADAAIAKANAENWTVVIAIVDAGGHLILLKRIDNTQIGSVEVAIKKAEASVKFKRPTKVFQDGMAAGNVGILGLPGSLPFEGGVPIYYDGRVIGAIGVSGVASSDDGIIAAAGLEAL